MAEGICRICGSVLYNQDIAAGTHESCRKQFGLLKSWPKSRRRASPCARCGHVVLVRCLMRERTGDATDAHPVAPMQVAFARRTEVNWRGKEKQIDQPSLFDKPVGVVEAWVCRACGFADLHVHEPENIPIGEEFGTELHDVSGATPFR